jgi:hypothetical protein
MRIDLNRSWARPSLIGAVALLSGMLIFFGGKVFVAERDNASMNAKLWLRAVRLEPGNAEYWGHVGLSRQWDLSSGGNREAIRYLGKAVEVNPRSSDLWMELADTYQTSGDPVDARTSYEKAQASYPISSEIAWRYGSFLLYEREFSGAYSQFQRAIAIDSSLTQSAIAACWQSNPSVTAIVDSVLPAKSAYYTRAIDYFVAKNLAVPAIAIWNRQLQLGLPIKLSETTPLVDMLIDQDRIAEAQQTWQQALAASNRPGGSSETGSLVFNGRFEQDVLNGGFDWRETALDGARFWFDNKTVLENSGSFRVQFDGSANLDFQNVFQYVVVQPNTNYRFSAYVRTEDISTESGMRFEILDPQHPTQLQILTPSEIGTNPWTKVQADLSSGPATHLLKITLRRMPTWKFDNKLNGSVWVSDVVLTPTKVSAKDSSG